MYNLPKQVTCNIAPFFGKDFHIFKEWIYESKKFQWNQKDYEIEVSFDDLFPHLQDHSSLVYIDNEAYDILTADT